jgi:hypothetical protein
MKQIAMHHLIETARHTNKPTVVQFPSFGGLLEPNRDRLARRG